MAFPSHAQVELWIQQYFAKFHPIFPFLRSISFGGEDSDESSLLLAVAAIGSKYTHQPREPRDTLLPMLGAILRQQRHEASAESAETSAKVLYVPGQQSVRSDRAKLRTLQASILNTILLLQSGERNSVEKALSSQHDLIRVCNSLGLLDVNASEQLRPAQSSEDQIGHWLENESKIRTGWMVWVCNILSVVQDLC